MMNDIFQQIITLFSDNPLTSFAREETYDEVILEVHCVYGKVVIENDLNKVFSMYLNPRDTIHLSILKDGNLVDNYDSSISDSDLSIFLNNTKPIVKSSDFDLKVTIVKNIKTFTLSVYYLNDFLINLKKRKFIHFLQIINNSLDKGKNEYIVFEIQDDNSLLQFETDSIYFVGKNIKPNIYQNQNRDLRHSQIRNLCYSNIIASNRFIPEDFYPRKKSNNIELNEIFYNTSLIFSLCFLFDIFNVDDKENYFDFKVNGYKTISNRLKVEDIDFQNSELYFKIYNWVYSGGSIEDKVGLTRNIISLNFNKDNLSLSESTFDAIQSGFKIYQKQNIKQYIEIRNKISDQLFELHNKADKIVDNFIGDYKKSIFTFVSYFVSVIVIRVISKGDIIGAFSFEVTILSIALLLISLLVMYYSIWEIKKQIKRYTTFYNNLKERYEDLLDKTDIERILNKNKDFNDNIEFINQKKKNYTEIWIASVIILIIVVVILGCMNSLYNIIKLPCNIL